MSVFLFLSFDRGNSVVKFEDFRKSFIDIGSKVTVEGALAIVLQVRSFHSFYGVKIFFGIL
jgi:hypothetical protein